METLKGEVAALCGFGMGRGEGEEAGACVQLTNKYSDWVSQLRIFNWKAQGRTKSACLPANWRTGEANKK